MEIERPASLVKQGNLILFSTSLKVSDFLILTFIASNGSTRKMQKKRDTNAF